MSTPKKTPAVSSDGAFSPIKFESPQTGSPHEELYGPAKTAKELALKIQNHVTAWDTLQKKSIHIIRNVQHIKKTALLTDNKYSEDLELPYRSLKEASDSFCSISLLFSQALYQCKCLSKLAYNEPFLISWTAQHLCDILTNVCEKYHKEAQVKQNITKNVCHSKDISELALFVAAWEKEPYLDSGLKIQLESLYLEFGIKRV